MKWNQDPIDLFDCRTRSWFIEAASSPKDVVILVDRSGSMTGMRREIARHVVHNILDTLGNNDYVNILTFSNTTDPLIDCFDSILVQANLANVRLLKEGMSTFRTEQIANLSLALVTAFRLLEAYRNDTNIGTIKLYSTTDHWVPLGVCRCQLQPSHHVGDRRGPRQLHEDFQGLQLE